MKDFWSDKDCACMSKISDSIRQCEKEYVEKFGELPKWNSINDVWNTKNKLDKGE